MGKSNKRKETENTGSTPTNKDPRTETSTDLQPGLTLSQVNESIAEKSKPSSSTIRSGSSISSTNTVYEREHQWKGDTNPKNCSQVVVDILTIDEQEFKDQLSDGELAKIFKKMTC